MATVGVRELRQRASELLRRVEAGETIEVTDHGRPVAVLAPLPEAEPLERLRAAGDVVPAARDLDDLPQPLPLPVGKEAPSRVLSRLRRDER
ncbi:MAG TPA: type II toxin-antitoxin system prevent-host-death family antitoxin [Candidatus Dormibacteraeota bacterium]|nr:type II toxin-antitoxin system prevent-host-death family antitoxin [Candidatus Dormibacteraeota bacterium]